MKNSKIALFLAIIFITPILAIATEQPEVQEKKSEMVEMEASEKLDPVTEEINKKRVYEVEMEKAVQQRIKAMYRGEKVKKGSKTVRRKYRKKIEDVWIDLEDSVFLEIQ